MGRGVGLVRWLPSSPPNTPQPAKDSNARAMTSAATRANLGTFQILPGIFHAPTKMVTACHSDLNEEPGEVGGTPQPDASTLRLAQHEIFQEIRPNFHSISMCHAKQGKARAAKSRNGACSNEGRQDQVSWWLKSTGRLVNP